MTGTNNNIPLQDPPGVSLEAKPRPGPRFTSLVLEDDPACAGMIATIIEKEGGRAVVCPTVQQAREAISEYCFDFSVLDHRLPDGTGASFYYTMRDAGIAGPVIMLTGLPCLSTAVELTRDGLFDYLTKPFDVEHLRNCLRRALLRVQPWQGDITVADIVTRSPAMRRVSQLIQRAAENPAATVLLTGETGVGKDLTARAIHHLTFQSVNPMPRLISLNCSTLPADMFEAELFGAEKGAYTGAYQQRVGLAEAAEGGTLFLDEIGEVSLLLQCKLLQFLESREYRRLGSSEAHSFTGRIIAATNRSLADEVKAGRFRADLWYRLDVFSIHILPLRERPEDLPELIERLLHKLSQKYQRLKPTIKPDDYCRLLQYGFPGNVRELRNLLERSLLQTPVDGHWLQLALGAPAVAKAVLDPPVIPSTGEASNTRSLTPLEAQEYSMIESALSEEHGVIRRAAAKLGLTHQSLLRRLQKWPELRPAHPRRTG